LLNFLAKYSYWFLFLVLEAISFVLLFQFNSYQGSVWFTSANAVSGKVYEQSAKVKSYFQLETINEELTKENLYLAHRLQLLNAQKEDSIADSLAHASALLQHLSPYKLIPAKIVHASLNKRDNLLTIDKGARDGVKRDMGVVCGTGVVGIVYLTILGEPEAIKTRAKNILGLKWNEERISIINPAESDKYEAYAEKLYELRKSKGLELSQAKDLMLDSSYFGTMMVFLGDADGMVSGAVNTTAHTIRPSLQFVKTKPGVNTVSSVFFMLLHDRVLVYGDCAVVPNPTAEQLADIAISSADSAIAFGIEPKVALLSYSSGNSGSGADVDKVREATALVKERRPELLVEGPIQYDAAVDPKVGKQKMPNSPVAGQANVLIFPDLNTGNNTYKAVQRETGGLAIGPMLQGLKKPVNDLSRGALIPDIYNTVLITAIQSEF
ncbi:MAG: phosphate acetyltransferase, partial [Capnocytophaga ochracea]